MFTLDAFSIEAIKLQPPTSHVPLTLQEAQARLKEATTFIVLINKISVITVPNTVEACAAFNQKLADLISTATKTGAYVRHHPKPWRASAHALPRTPTPLIESGWTTNTFFKFTKAWHQHVSKEGINHLTNLSDALYHEMETRHSEDDKMFTPDQTAHFKSMQKKERAVTHALLRVLIELQEDMEKDLKTIQNVLETN